ncbi:MAG: hypothetical protein GX859_02280 [Corynebacterium humireducens]|jgi:DNA-binding transcriptional regulator LsrR (DeoR family)|uniref:Uncharacterized protein n=1 Tax=Corynebacterium humireducens TaxID=1223514 RepID=A0A7X6PM11_9CORY|nr:hypothetical protein [Corynebacterium humireducens]
MTHPNQYSAVKRPEPGDVQALYDAGYGRNEIARRLQVSPRQVDRVAKDLGLAFNQELTSDAVAARVSRANEQRIELSEKLRRIAALELDGITSEQFDPNERKAMMTTAAIAVQRDLEIAKYLDERFPEDTGTPEALDMLADFFGQIRGGTA